MKKKYWKAITKIGKKFVSAITEGDAMVHYLKGKKVVAPEWLAKRGYHLLIFKKYSHVKEFIKTFPGLPFEVWEVEAEDFIPLPKLAIVPWLLCNKNRAGLYFLIKGLFKKYKKRNEISWPLGTVMAKKVKLIRKVK